MTDSGSATVPATKATPTPILKRTSLVGPPPPPSESAAASASGPSAERRNSRKMQWDEDNLAENKAYMDSNPKMKILEPDTPFVDYSMDRDEELIKEEAEEEAREQEAAATAAAALPLPASASAAQDNGQVVHARLVMLNSKLASLAGQQAEEEEGVEAEGGGAGVSSSSSAVKRGSDACSTPPQKTQADHDAEFKMKRRAVYADEGKRCVCECCVWVVWLRFPLFFHPLFAPQLQRPAEARCSLRRR